MSAVPTALVVGADATGRAPLAALLQLTGWDVREAEGTREALGLARRLELDLVVVDLDGPAGEASALLRRLRLVGCRAHLIAAAAAAGAADRSAALEAGALACLPRPVDARLLTGLLARRAPGAQAPVAADVPDAELLDRLQEVYAAALPGRLAAIADGARSGDAAALARASATLAGTSAQLGHLEVAAICRAIARDARRGVLARERVTELWTVASA